VEGTISHPHVVEKIPSSSHESIDSLLWVEQPRVNIIP
jgi:hypothetical protein